jgi:hypothetical protein
MKTKSFVTRLSMLVDLYSTYLFILLIKGYNFSLMFHLWTSVKEMFIRYLYDFTMNYSGIWVETSTFRKQTG